jgi:hypothetical protein
VLPFATFVQNSRAKLMQNQVIQVIQCDGTSEQKEPSGHGSETAADGVELTANLVREAFQRCNCSNRDQGRDQRILDQVLTGIVVEQIFQEPRRADHRISPCVHTAAGSAGAPTMACCFV